MKTNTLPNKISMARIFFTPILIVSGWMQQETVFLVLFAVLLISDFIDGFLARRLDQQTRRGSQLDTVGDVLMAVCTITGGWILWPQRVASEAVFLFLSVGFLGLSGIICLLKHHHFPSYHTWSAKVSTTFVGVGVWLFFAGITPWVFRIAIGILALSAVESIVITLLLSPWRTDIPSVFHAVRTHRVKEKKTNCEAQP